MSGSDDSSKRILLGVSGGIAAYKSAELARLLTERGYRVQVIMTAAAQQFVQPLTFAALTGERVLTGLFPASEDASALSSAIDHIAVGQAADLLLVAPATADVLAKMAHGLADDFLTTTYLAFSGPVVVAPAMNTNMWEHPATRKNIETLQARGTILVEPGSGSLACGMVGPGRLAELERIAATADMALAPEAAKRDLGGETVLITAGPTREALDPVRFLSNRSSGRMGYALADEARRRGARVIVVSGPVSLPPPQGCELIPVTTAAEMHAAVLARWEETTIFVAAAAVSDYRPKSPATGKMKKNGQTLTFHLEPTEDILAGAGRRKGSRFLVGFAAETSNVIEEGKRKLLAKHCDLLVANPVGDDSAGTGFDAPDNQGWLVTAAGDVEELPRMTKPMMARRIFDRVVALLQRASHAKP